MALARAFVALLLVAPWLATPGAAATEQAIVVTGDADLLDKATKRQWKGTGSPVDPIVIGPMTLQPTTGQGILLQNTSLHVKLIGITIHGAGRAQDGIRLDGASNVVIEGADLEFNGACIKLQKYSDGRRESFPTGVVIRASKMRACAIGLHLERASDVIVENNAISVSDEDVRLVASQGNVFRSNNLSVASGQVGFSFQDEVSYNNSIDPSNVVNFVPMRWYVDVKGKPGEPARIEGAEADVKGMTNVAQVMCYRCAHVDIVRPQASVGIASGVAVVKGDEVRVLDAVVEGNKASGVHVTGGRNVTVRGLTAERDGTGVLILGTANATVRASTVSNALEAGVVFRQLTNATVDVLTLRGNAMGLLLDVVDHANLSGVDARTGKGEGLRMTLASQVDLRHSILSENEREGLVVDRSGRVNVSQVETSRNKGDGLRAAQATTLVVGAHVAADNKLSGIHLAESTGAIVNASRLENNTKAGVLIGLRTQATSVTANDLRRNGQAGIWLDSAGSGVLVAGNKLALQPAHVKLTKTANARFETNLIDQRGGETGFVFDDEASYENLVSTNNTVNGQAVQWHVALAGTSRSPVELKDLKVTQPNVTNVAQIMVYKSSYVTLRDPVATHGPARAIYVLRSSSVSVLGGEATDSGVGVEFRGTQSVAVEGTKALRDTVGIVVADTTNASITRVATAGTTTGLRFADKSSRDAVVSEIDATGALGKTVDDPTLVVGPPSRSNHLIVDAGVDKVTLAGHPVAFDDAFAAVRSGAERILRQTWDMGDGIATTSTDEAVLRPNHTYATPGTYTARYTVETAAGMTIVDTVRVTVPDGVGPPRGVEILANEDGVWMRWKAPDTPVAVKHYAVYRGNASTELERLRNHTNDTTISFHDRRPLPVEAWYSVVAITQYGEGERSAPLAVQPWVDPNATVEKPAEEKKEDDAPPTPAPTKAPRTPPTRRAPSAPAAQVEAQTPLPPWALLAGAALAALAARRRN